MTGMWRIRDLPTIGQILDPSIELLVVFLAAAAARDFDILSLLLLLHVLVGEVTLSNPRSPSSINCRLGL
jgi:hypothetical protein